MKRRKEETNKSQHSSTPSVCLNSWLRQLRTGEKKSWEKKNRDAEMWNGWSNLSEVTCLLSSMFRDLVLVAGDGPPWERLAAEARR